MWIPVPQPGIKLASPALGGSFLTSGPTEKSWKCWILTLKNHHMLSCFSHVWLWNSKDSGPSGSAVHGIPQARIQEWLPFPPSGALPMQRLNLRLLCLLHWQASSFHYGLCSIFLCLLFFPLNCFIWSLLSPGFRVPFLLPFCFCPQWVELVQWFVLVSCWGWIVTAF